MFLTRRRNLVAVLAIVVVSIGLVVATSFGLQAYIDRQSQEQLELSARQTVSRAEWRLDQVIGALREVSARAVNSCADVGVDKLRQAVIAITPIKQLAYFGPGGLPACDSLRLSGPSIPLSPEIQGPSAQIALAVVRMAETSQRVLRIRWLDQGAPLTLAAFVPVDILLPEMAVQMLAAGPAERLMLDEATVLGETRPDESAEFERITARARSARYPLLAVVSNRRGDLVSQHPNLFAAVVAGSLLLSFLIVALASFMLGRGTRGNPVAEIERAIKANEFVPYYQPIVNISSGRILGAEVLVRWRKPDGAMVSPASFIPLAESSGLILDMTRALMRQVRDEAGAVLGARPKFKIGFNLSAHHFENNAIVEDIYEVFGESPIRMTQIVAEVTERQPLVNLAAARRVIAELQEVGVKVAIDDVGTGHGGLSYMLKLGVDIIKVDKMFVDAIGTERYSTTIIETLVELARNMRMEIVAEGVENFEQVAYLRERGIHQAQGYVFAPPLPGPSFLELIEAIDPLPAAIAQKDAVPVEAAEASADGIGLFGPPDAAEVAAA